MSHGISFVFLVAYANLIVSGTSNAKTDLVDGASSKKSADNGTTIVASVPSNNVIAAAAAAADRTVSKENYEEYDSNRATNDRDLIFDTFKTYEDEPIEKGIRKLDTSVENAKSIESNDTSVSGGIGNDDDVRTPSRSTSKDTLVDDDRQEMIFEDSETQNGNANVSGTLVTKMIPELLKYNGRMMMVPASEEQSDPNVRRRSARTNVGSDDNGGVVQKLAPRKTRHQESNDVVSINAASPYRGEIRRNFSKLEDIFDLFNPYKLAVVWPRNEELHKLSRQCANHMERYLDALRKAEPWAIQMWDASGHYSGGYFWGNQYWMGSRTQCGEIIREHSELPFKVGFSIARTNLTVNVDMTRKHGQSQFVGICIPYACDKGDVQIMVEQSIKANDDTNDDRKTEIIKIKSHYDYYYMKHDRTFWLIIFAAGVALIMLFIGTTLDIYLEKKQFCADGACGRKNFKYDNYTYAVNPPLRSYTDNIKSESEGCIAECRNSSSGNVTPSTDSEDNKCVLWQEILLSFSAIRNMRQICDSSIGADTIPIIHGLRSISMGWVILGHTCIIAFKYSDNMDFRKVVERELLFQTINNTAFTVDTFFFISGLLVSFLYFRTMAKVNVNKITKTTGILSHCIEFIGLLGYRFCRLTVPYIFTIGLVEISVKWFHYNSVFDPPADDHINCPQYWWRNLLYINTLFPFKDMCMLWSWYLADDTQFYVLGVILLILAIRHFRAAATSVVILLVSSWCITGYIAYSNNHMPNIDDPLALFDKIYDKPWTRFGPYLIGMTVGWILFKTNCKIAIKKPCVIIGWLSCAIAMLSLIYGLYKTQLDSLTAAAYSSLSHTAWAVGLSWIVIACTTGHGGYMNRLLSSKLLIPFSRTAYCAYLIHPILMRWMVMRRDSPVHLAEETIAIIFLGQLVASYIFAFVLSITFEAPIVSLLKIVSPTKRNKFK